MSNTYADTKNLRNVTQGTTDLAKKGAEAAEASYEQLKEQVETLKADLSALGAAAREAGYESAREALVSARRAGRRAVKVAEEGYDYAGNQLDEALTSAGRFTRERPAAALGLAACAGALFAMLLTRR